MSTRVVITGLGVVSPIGNDLESYWEALCAGRSGISHITHFDASDYRTKIAGEAEDCIPEGMTAKDLNRLDRYSVFAIEAADQAWRQSGIDMDQEDPFRCGAIIGSGIGGIETIEDEVIRLHDRGPRRVSPFMIPKGITNTGAGNVAIRLGLRGPNKSIVSACSTGNHCIEEAMMLIQGGKADVIVAGGAEASVTPFSIAGFSAMRAMSTRNDDPERASRPFDKDRDGFVLGEGAGCLILESEEHAKARGADIYAEIVGFGMNADGKDMINPAVEGAADAMRIALDGVTINDPSAVYINAHGTGTLMNDPTETKAIREVFGAGADDLVVSSTKSMHGHLLGAAGGVEAIEDGDGDSKEKGRGASRWAGRSHPPHRRDRPPGLRIGRGDQCDLPARNQGGRIVPDHPPVICENQWRARHRSAGGIDRARR